MFRHQTHALIEWAIVLIALGIIGFTITSFIPTGVGQQSVSIASISDVSEVGGSRFPWNAQLSDGAAPNFKMLNRDGQEVALSDFRGQVVFLNFWATTCEPCRKEIPDLGALAKKMTGLPFVILAVTTDTDWAAVDKMFPTKDLEIHIGLDPQQGPLVKSLFGTNKIPESYVIDKNGQLRMRFVNVHPWDDERLHRYLEVLTNE
jgi:cytochrome c biogenesis protein CcmG, thiol:disulfide interchange protein DsbE